MEHRLALIENSKSVYISDLPKAICVISVLKKHLQMEHRLALIENNKSVYISDLPKAICVISVLKKTLANGTQIRVDLKIINPCTSAICFSNPQSAFKKKLVKLNASN